MQRCALSRAYLSLSKPCGCPELQVHGSCASLPHSDAPEISSFLGWTARNVVLGGVVSGERLREGRDGLFLAEVIDMVRRAFRWYVAAEVVLLGTRAPSARSGNGTQRTNRSR